MELSPAMVARAKATLAEREVANVSFRLGDVCQALSDLPDDHFHTATIVMALHEMPTDARVPVLTELCRVAARVLCVDFAVPMPWNLAGLRNRFFELAAGPEHFAGYRDFTRRGGLSRIADEAGVEHALVRRADAGSLEIRQAQRIKRGGGAV